MSEVNKNEVENRKDKKTIDMDIIIGAGLLLFSAVALGGTLYSSYKCQKMERLLFDATRHISTVAAVDVEQAIVDRAIKEATKNEVDRVVINAVRDVRNDIGSEVAKQVKDAVQISYSTIKKSVTDSIAKEASKIDAKDLMNDVTEKAKDILVERFDGKLDNLLTEYNHNLENVSKIYQSIASSMAENKTKDVSLKIG